MDNLPTTSLNRFQLPAHPSGMPVRPISTLYHKQGVFVVGWGPGTPERAGLSYEVRGSAFGWRRLTRNEKPAYVMDDLAKRTLERNELGDLDRALWRVNDEGEPMDPWKRVAQLSLVRVEDGTPLIFETDAPSAIEEVQKLVEKIRWLARDKGDANPVIVTGTRQDRNPKNNRTWWVPTFTITQWNAPDGTVLSLEPEPQQTPVIEGPAPALNLSEPMKGVGGVPLAAPRVRNPRNAYGRLHAKQRGKPRTALEDYLDDEVP
jgi:hypothetical protein